MVSVHPKDRVDFAKTDMGITPMSQMPYVDSMENFIRIEMRPNPPPTAIFNANELLFDIEPTTLNNVKDICLVLYVKNNTAAPISLVPGPYMFRRIRVIANKGSGDTLAFIYPECMVWALSCLPNDEGNAMAHYANCQFLPLGKHKRKLTHAPPLGAGEEIEIMLPLPLSFMKNSALHFQHLREDFRLAIELERDVIVDVGIPATSADITLQNCYVMVRQDEDCTSVHDPWLSSLRTDEHCYKYLDVIKIDFNDKLLSSSAETKFDMQNVIGKSPFALVIHKRTTAPDAVDRSKWDWLDFGDEGRFDLRSPSNEPLLGKGNDLTQRYLELLFTAQSGSKPLSGLITLPFSHDPLAGRFGGMDGWYDFKGDKDVVAITYPAPPVAETVDVIIQAAPASVGPQSHYVSGPGGVQYTIAGTTITDRSDENYYNLKDPTAVDNFQTVGTDVAEFKFDAQDGPVLTELPDVKFGGFRSDLAGAEHYPALPVPIVTTKGKRGWASGTDYQTEFFVYYFRELKISRDGRLKCHTL